MQNTYALITIAGQITAVVPQKVKEECRSILAQEIMRSAPKIEQVGFLDLESTPYPTFTMMGDELSVIGSLAAGIYLENNTQQMTFMSSGFETPITLQHLESLVSIAFPNVAIVLEKDFIVSFNGITFFVVDRLPINNQVLASELQLLDMLLITSPAAGIVYYFKNQIYPVVKVKKTNTLVWESACGSGSLAFYLITGCSKIIQPSRAILNCSRENDTLRLSVLRKDIVYET